MRRLFLAMLIVLALAVPARTAEQNTTVPATEKMIMKRKIEVRKSVVDGLSSYMERGQHVPTQVETPGKSA